MLPAKWWPFHSGVNELMKCLVQRKCEQQEGGVFYCKINSFYGNNKVHKQYINTGELLELILA